MSDASLWLVVAACAVATYATRVGGHLILSRFGTIAPRAEAALDAVPTAVLASLVAPAAFTRGWPEAIAVGLSFLLAMRLPPMAVVVSGLAAVVVLRGLL